MQISEMPRQELLKQCGLTLEEPMIGFLLNLTNASDALDYLQAGLLSSQREASPL